AAGGLATDRQRAGNRQVRPVAAAGLPHRADVRRAHRNDFPVRGPTMMSRKTRLILAVAVAAALFGYRALKHQPGAEADAPPAGSAAAAPVEPVKPVMLGEIAFTPCSLS